MVQYKQGFNLALRQTMKAERLTREQIANNLGCSAEAVDSWCSGRSRIGPIFLNRLCSFLAARGVEVGSVKQLYEGALAEHGFLSSWPPPEARTSKFTLCLLGSSARRKELEMIRVISGYLRGRGQIPLIFDCGDSVDSLIGYLKVANEVSVSNLILCGMSLPHDLYRLILNNTHKTSAFVIFMMTDCPAEIAATYENAYVVGWSDYSMAYKAVSLLVEAGHKKIGTVSHARHSPRLQAYFQVISDRGLEKDPDLVIIGGDTPGRTSISDAAFVHKLEHFLLTEDISAYFAPTELLTLVMPVLLMKHGKRLPHDVSLCGMAYREWIGAAMHMPLTYMSYPTEAVTRYVLDILFQQWGGSRSLRENRYINMDDMVVQIDVEGGSVRNNS